MKRRKKWIALMLAACIAMPGNSISIVRAAETSETISMGTEIDTMFDASYRDNTWVFTGGEAVQGGFEQTRGIRNYIGQFEEYIRWTLGGSSPINGRQRFAFNTGKAGRTLSEVVDNFEVLVADFETKAAVYMVGAEDYMQGEENLSEFKADLASFIDQSLALKENNGGFAVIQKPFASRDDETNALIQKYCDAVDEVADGYQTSSEKYAQIVVVDHFTATNTDDFKANNLQDDGTLNARGHLEIGRQFTEAVYGSSSNYPGSNVSLNRTEMKQPEEYLDVQPTATASDSSLKVEIPEGTGDSWNYELDMDGMLVSGNSEDNSFEITGLTQGSSYVLKIQSQDGKKQLVTTKGVVAEGETSVKNSQVLDANQQAIVDMVNGEEPMTWLFMGDSITHACAYTYGYDGIAQIFEKYVKEELGRCDDIVLNTAVSNANTATTIQEIDQRLEKFTPDVVSIMLGTNDASSIVDITADEFEENMRVILDKIKEINENAVIILRSPTPVWDSNRVPYIVDYINKVESLAEEYGTIYIDQYTELREATTTYSWLKSSLFPDALHPDANGHRIMANKFIKACGLWTEDSEMTNLFYDLSITEETSDITPEVLAGEDKIAVSAYQLGADSGFSVGDIVLKATAENGQSYEVTAEDSESYAVLEDLPSEAVYQVEVSAYLKDSAKKVTFNEQDVTLAGGQTIAFEDLIFEKENLEIVSGTPVDLTSEAYADRLMALEEGTIIVKYTSTSDYLVQTLFSVANGTTGNNNRHMQFYIRPDGRLGCEIRNDSSMNYHIYKDNVVAAGEENIVAIKADMKNREYKLFANGALVMTVNADTLGGYRFADDITGLDTVQIGATKRGGSAAYTFAGTIHDIKVYSTALSDEEILEAVYKEPSPETPVLKAGSISVTEEHMTEEQPFAAGTAGSQKFRIPALITLENGELLAAADARWTGGADWGGLDTIASVSSDNGKTWYYSFPIYFPDSNEIYPGNEVATTAIDPVLVQGSDGTIYCIADMNPSGITTGDIMPSTGTGYVEIDGTWRLALTGTYTKPNESDASSYGDVNEYEYYVGDFDENGFAPVLNKSDHTPTQWGVDAWYNIYTVNAETGAYEATLTQTMVNDTDVIQQNAFYKDSVLHVFNTGYLWLVTSKDNGRTWGNPQILNTQIKREGEIALLASPGQGITTSDGDIVIPFYDHGDGQENASVIWSSDNGATWTRSNDVSGMWSSESEVVELNNGVLRMFFRNGTGRICYADITKTDGVWTMGAGIQTDISVCSTCNVTAIRHSDTINGKMVVLVGCPGGSGRANGKIYTFLVDEDNTMELYHTYSVNSGTYAYSCMTELSNKNIGLLWEYEGTAIRYDELSADEVLGRVKNITINEGETYVEEWAADTAKEITTSPNAAIATVTSEIVTQESVTVLHDYASASASSLDSFSSEAGIYNTEDAEFTFEASGEYWKIYHGSTYMDLSNAGNYYGTETNLTIEKIDPDTAAAGDETFRIKLPTTNRYALFYKTNMVFDAYVTTDVDSAVSGNSNLMFDLVLLEKQDTVSANDVIPGYTRASEIKDGGVYLITYLWDDGSVLVLYPANGQSSQTKLAGDTVDVKTNVLTITGIAPGETKAVVDGVTYNITVMDPADDPNYDGRDIPISALTATAGNEEALSSSNTTEGPAEFVLDNDTGTLWHTDWDGHADRADHWIQFEVADGYEVDGLRYLPRSNAGGTNAFGVITQYEILVSASGTFWEVAAEGSWDAVAGWKTVSFDPHEVKYVRLMSVDSVSDSRVFSSAAEIRLTGSKIEEPVRTNPFEDVFEGDYYYDAVLWAVENGVTSGLTPTLFGPAEGCTRAQVVTFLWNAAGKPDAGIDTCAFTDVNENGYYYEAMLWAVENNITAGVTATEFKPNDTCSRGQIVTFLWRVAGQPDAAAKNCEFIDVPDYAYYYDAILWAVEEGIAYGMTETEFEPETECTRGQIVTFLCRYYSE